MRNEKSWGTILHSQFSLRISYFSFPLSDFVVHIFLSTNEENKKESSLFLISHL